MTATAGFDLVMEIGPDALRDAIRANIRLGDVRLNPPFEMQQSFDFKNLAKKFPQLPQLAQLGSGVSYTIVNSMTVALERERDVRIVLGFADSCIENDDPGKFSVYGLAGTVSILLQLQLVAGTGFSLRTIGYDAAATKVEVTFTPPSLSAIDAALSAAGLGAVGSATLVSQAEQAVRDKLGNTSTPLPGFSFRVTPGTEGQLFPALQFERLELRNVGTQAIGIFGSCRIADHNRGDPATLTQRPLPPGQNVRVTLAAASFHTLAFCPAMGKKLGVQAGDVPGSCGGGSPVAHAGGEMAWIEDRFVPGAILVSGMVQKSGGCVKNATVRFQTRFPVSVSHGSLVIGAGIPKFGEADVTLHWYCDVLTGLAFGPLGAVVLEIGRDAIDDAAEEAVNNAISQLLKNVPGGGSGFALPNSTFTSVEVTPEAMTIGGATRFSVPPPDPPYLAVRGAVELVHVPDSDSRLVFLPNPELLHRGLVHIKRLCIDGDYPVIERFSRLEGRYWLETYRIPRPLNRTIVLDSWDSDSPYSTPTLLVSVPVPTAGAGDVVIPVARCTYPFPLPDGTVVKQPVTVSYQVDRRFIRLFNVPSDGSYALTLRLQVTNAAGLDERIALGVTFVGNDVLILGSYSADLAKCIKSIVDKVNSYAHSTEPRPWEPVEHPRPDEIFARVDALLRSGDPDLVEVSTFVGLAHQAAYLSASLAVPSVPMKILASISE